MAQAMGGNTQLVAGNSYFATLVVEMGFALVESPALRRQGSFAVAQCVELCSLQYVALPGPNCWVFIKIHIPRQTTLGAMHYPKKGAAVGGLGIELDGLLGPKPKGGLHFELDRGDRALSVQLGQHFAQVYLVLIPRLTLCRDVLAGHRCGNALLVEQGFEVMPLWNGVLFSNEGQKPAQDADLVLDGGRRLAARTPVADKSQGMRSPEFPDILNPGTQAAQFIQHAQELFGVERAGAF